MSESEKRAEEGYYHWEGHGVSVDIHLSTAPSTPPEKRPFWPILTIPIFASLGVLCWAKKSILLSYYIVPSIDQLPLT